MAWLGFRLVSQIISTESNFGGFSLQQVLQAQLHTAPV